MKEKWVVRNVRFDVKNLIKELNISELLGRLLVNRGITDIQEGKKYINPTIDYLNDPKLMKDLVKGVNIIKESIENKSKVMIVGDYDVDGIISTYILVTAFIRCGASVIYHIPDRKTEGYGINESIITLAKEKGANVLITCDNGIAAMSQVKLAKSFGMKVIITDHHDIPFVEDCYGKRKYVIPEADAVINPKQLDCDYPFKNLCGAGVAFKFVQVLYEYCGIKASESYKLIEFVAIATVCDVVDLVEENRIIVKKGLELINNTSNIGLKALFEETDLLGKNINVYSLGFVVGPSINASGRLEQAIIALELLLETDGAKATELAKRLHDLNKNRQDLTIEGLEAAIKSIENTEMLHDKVLVVFLPDIHESVAGIIAGRLKEMYNLPTFVLTRSKEGVKGSGRSIEEYNMFEGLLKCTDLLEKFGGHPMAAGLSMKEENVAALRIKLNELCKLSDEDIMPKVKIDMALPFSSATAKLVEDLKLMEPYGKGNSKPVFAERKVRVMKASILGVNKNVLKLKLKSLQGKNVEGIYFGDIKRFDQIVSEAFGDEELSKIYQGRENLILIDLIFNVSINEYMGNKTVQIIISNLRPSLN